ncbi:hypothetical protein JT27_18225 [Alcaligenes faecalis]|uniref:hypothetical protein n=1 Tax=Alcaligenes faecalis TaxID=511 RepID=UPI00052DCE9B|nr:hypothetical protein [Alcaligenes faecalis]KGP00271.1 hypothetical protein JT27_18225 [Alcaligenes faecalis]
MDLMTLVGTVYSLMVASVMLQHAVILPTVQDIIDRDHGDSDPVAVALEVMVFIPLIAPIIYRDNGFGALLLLFDEEYPCDLAQMAWSALNDDTD